MKPISREFIERCERWIQLHRQEMIEDIQSFVRIRSVSNAQAARPGMPFGPECGRMLSFALDRARQLGFEVEDHEGYCGSVYLGNRESTLGYMAHLDTVPEGEGWIYPPFACVQVEDCLIGRGVQDNKGPAVVGLYLLRMFRDLMVPMRHGLELVLGVSEETGMQDLSYYAEHVRQPALSLVADGGFPLNYAQKGSLSACISLPADRSILDFEGGHGGQRGACPGLGAAARTARGGARGLRAGRAGPGGGVCPRRGARGRAHSLPGSGRPCGCT